MGQVDLIGEVSEHSLRLRHRQKACDSGQVGACGAPGQKKSRARKTAAPDAPPLWTLEPHVCRSCFGRLVSTPDQASGRTRYLCTNCGAEAVADSAEAVCACGLQVRTPAGVLVDAGLRCIPNPDPRPDFPSCFVAAPV